MCLLYSPVERDPPNSKIPFPPYHQHPPSPAALLPLQRHDIRQRPHGGNRQRVDLRVRLGVVVLSTVSIISSPKVREQTNLDVQEVRRLLERRHVPVQVPHPLVQRRIPAPDVPDVALEVLHVHRLLQLVPPLHQGRDGGGGLTSNLMMVTHSRTSTSVNFSPNQYGPGEVLRCSSARSNASKSATTFFSYASCVVANPLLYTPLLIKSYCHAFASSTSPLNPSGYKSTALYSSPTSPSNALLNIRTISLLSLLTIRFVTLSHSTGTVNLPV